MEPAADALPFLDEHAHAVSAPPEAAWAALVRVLPRAFGGRGAERYARLVRCDATAPDGRFPQEGGAIAGFRVARADPPREMALVGRHRFSTYALTFRLEPLDGGRGTRVRAETRAVFPGVGGRLYRLAVIRTRGHVWTLRRLLRALARSAERSATRKG